jgi:hypothetical protein
LKRRVAALPKWDALLFRCPSGKTVDRDYGRRGRVIVQMQPGTTLSLIRQQHMADLALKLTPQAGTPILKPLANA